MSAYKGHRGPNVSQYIANLNQLSPPQESLNTLAPAEEDFSAFLNTDFFDINNGPAVDLNSADDLDLDFAAEQSAQSDLGDSSRKHSVIASVEPNMDFNLNGKHSLCLSSSYPSLCCDSGHGGSILFATRRPMGVGGRHMENPAMRPACNHHPHTSYGSHSAHGVSCSLLAGETCLSTQCARCAATSPTTFLLESTVLPSALQHG